MPTWGPSLAPNECPPQVWSFPPAPIHSTNKGLPSAHLLRSLPMLCSPLPSPWGPTCSLGQGLMGVGGQVGGPGGR